MTTSHFKNVTQLWEFLKEKKEKKNKDAMPF